MQIELGQLFCLKFKVRNALSETTDTNNLDIMELTLDLDLR